MTGEEVFNFVASGQRMCRTSAMSSELYVIARYSLPQEKAISIKKWLRLRYVLLLVILYHAKDPNPMLWLANIPARDYPPVHNSEKKEIVFFTITAEIHARSLANFLSSICGHTHEFKIHATRRRVRAGNSTICYRKTNRCQFLMRLACYW